MDQILTGRVLCSSLDNCRTKKTAVVIGRFPLHCDKSKQTNQTSANSNEPRGEIDPVITTPFLSVSFRQATAPARLHSNTQEVALRRCSWFARTQQASPSSRPIRRRDRSTGSSRWSWDAPTTSCLHLKLCPWLHCPISPWCWSRVILTLTPPPLLPPWITW